MTVNTLTSSAEFETDGANRFFPFTFKFLDSKDLVVAYIDAEGIATPLTLNVDYTVSGEGSEAGGQVITTLAPANLGRLVITREMKASQLTSLRNQGRFFAEVHETVFDRLTMLLQQALAQGARALRTSILEPAGISSLPLMIRRANRLLAFDSLGNPVESNLTLEQLEQQPNLAADAVIQAQEAADAANGSASQAQTAAGLAAGSAATSSNSATLAQKWAENPEDTPVQPGLFSARHWANKAAAAVASIAALYTRMTAIELRATNLEFSYISSNQSYANGGTVALSHGLAVRPMRVTWEAVCLTADAGYSVNAVVILGEGFNWYTSPVGYGFTVEISATQIIATIANGGLVLINKVSKTTTTLTPASWAIRAKASKS